MKKPKLSKRPKPVKKSKKTKPLKKPTRAIPAKQPPPAAKQPPPAAKQPPPAAKQPPPAAKQPPPAAKQPQQFKLWEDFLVSISDEEFINIIHNYLGSVSAPFNKRELIERLRFFIQSDDIQQATLDRIDTDDMEILSIIDAGNFRSEEQIFLTLDILPHIASTRLLNLLDRLLVFRHPGNRNFLVNPHFRDGLISRGLTALLQPERPAQANVASIDDIADADNRAAADISVNNTNIPSLWFNDDTAIGMFSILKEKQSVLTKRGAFRKPFLARIDKSLPHFSNQRNWKALISIDSLDCLGLLERTGQEIRAHLQNWRAFGQLSPEQRHIYYWAAYIALRYFDEQYEYFVDDFDSPSLPQFTKDVLPIAEFISAFIRSLQPGAIYKLITFDRVRAMQNIESPIPFTTIVIGLYHLDVFIPQTHGNDPMNTEVMLNPKLGALIKTRSGIESPDKNPDKKPDTAENSNSSLALVHGDFHITLHPGIGFHEKLTIAALCKLQICENICRFELSRESLLSGFAEGIGRGELLQTLRSLNASVPQNISFSIEDWEHEYFRITLQSGYLVNIDKKAELIRSLTPRLNSVKDLGNGNFLFPSDDLRWITILEKAGFAVRSVFDAVVNRHKPPQPPPSPFTEHPAAPPAIHEKPRGAIQKKHWERSLRHRKKLELQVDTLNRSDDQKAELRRRIQNGTILTLEQLKITVFHSQSTEAGTPDHNAKLLLIQKAIDNDNLLEISMTGDFPNTSMLIKPFMIMKARGADVLQGLYLKRSCVIEIENIHRIKRIITNLFQRI